MKTLEYIKNKYKLDLEQKRKPLEIPNTNRETLAQIFCEVGFKVGAEIGVERGIYSEVLLKANPDLQLFSIDAWTAYKGYRDHVSQEKMDRLYKEAQEKLNPYGGRSVMMKGFSVDVAHKFPDNSLDFVYIDGNHEFQQVVNDICVWDKKVRVGGIVAGHDYVKRKDNGYLMHVPQALHGYVDAYQIKPLFVLGRKDVINGELRDRSRSWFYVKQPKSPIRPGHERA